MSLLAAEVRKVDMQVTRVTRALGARVEGVDLSAELSQTAVDRLGELLVEHRILFSATSR